MQCLYTAGAMDVLMKNNICFDAIAGVSAGALFGINYKSKQFGRVLRYNLKYAGISENLGIKSLIKTGDLMSKSFNFDELPYKLDVMDDITYRIFIAFLTEKENSENITYYNYKTAQPLLVVLLLLYFSTFF